MGGVKRGPLPLRALHDSRDIMSILRPTPAKLALEDGTVYSGTSIGAPGEVAGEVVFNTIYLEKY